MFIEKTPIVRQFTTFHDTLRLTALFESREESTASSATISGTESENTYMRLITIMYYLTIKIHEDSGTHSHLIIVNTIHSDCVFHPMSESTHIENRICSSCVVYKLTDVVVYADSVVVHTATS